MKDYTGQSIFIGIDVHKKTYSVTAVFDGKILKRDTMFACPQKLVDYCFKFFPGASVYSAYEAGFCGFHFHRILVQNGIHNIVVHASSIEIASRDRVKTDKRDSLKIATQLSVGRLKCIHIPSVEREAFRSVSRLREKFVRDRTRIGVQIKSFLNLNGLLNYKDTKKVSRKWILNLIDAVNSSNSEISFDLKIMSKRWIAIDNEIIEIENRLKLQAASEIKLERIYRSAPGIGVIVSRILINELGDMSQFKNEGALFSYTGLTPQEYSSGEHIRQGHISRQGKSILRKILVQAAWRAIKKDNYLKEVFERISIKTGKKRAIIAIARRLIGHIRACLQKNELYVYKEALTTNIV
jgi:transposase